MREFTTVKRNLLTIPPLARVAASLLLAVAAAIAPAQLPAQIAIPAEALQDETLFRQVMSRGQELETQRRWGEALAHYEKASKEYPQRQDLRDHLKRVRVHYDVCRRYDDTSFTRGVDRLSKSQASDVYSELLRKIETHYVVQPDWQRLAECGVTDLAIALSEPAFQSRNGMTAATQDVDAFRTEVSRRMDVTTVRSSRQVQEVASNVAALAWDRIGLRPQATIMEFSCGAVGSLDQYSCFLSEGQLDDVFSQIEGSFVGLGIELKAEDQALLIVDVITGGPAEQAGIRPGDKIVAVDDIETQDVSTDEAADMLKGPEGSPVRLVVVSTSEQRQQMQLVRRRVEVPSVTDVKIVDDQYAIGYMRLTSFQKTTCRDVDSALWKLHRDGMRSLIIDVRGNPGGLLNASVELADKFVASGNLVSTRGRNTHEDYDYQAHSVGTWRVPLVVLIDGDTASASEIFAGAIRDHRRGTVVGERSYGKGSVQGIFKLNTADLGVRLTTAKFFSPNGYAISDRGVQPDLVVRGVLKPTEGGESLAGDAALDAGLQVARNGMLSQR